MPSFLCQIHTYAPRQSVWIPDPEDDWVEATVIKQEGGRLSVHAKGAKNGEQVGRKLVG